MRLERPREQWNLKWERKHYWGGRPTRIGWCYARERYWRQTELTLQIKKRYKKLKIGFWSHFVPGLFTCQYTVKTYSMYYKLLKGEVCVLLISAYLVPNIEPSTFHHSLHVYCFQVNKCMLNTHMCMDIFLPEKKICFFRLTHSVVFHMKLDAIFNHRAWN